MSAQRCFTPWNWPMGRPNCSRTTAWLGGGVDAPGGEPTASAASSTAASPRCRADPGGHVTTRPRGTARRCGPHGGDPSGAVERRRRLDVDVGRRRATTQHSGGLSVASAATSSGTTGSTRTSASAAESTASHVPSTTSPPAGSAVATSGRGPMPTVPTRRPWPGRADGSAATSPPNGPMRSPPGTWARRGQAAARPAQLLDHHDQLGQPKALAAGGLGTASPSQPCAASSRQNAGTSRSRRRAGPGHRRREVPGGPARGPSRAERGARRRGRCRPFGSTAHHGAGMTSVSEASPRGGKVPAGPDRRGRSPHEGGTADDSPPPVELAGATGRTSLSPEPRRASAPPWRPSSPHAAPRSVSSPGADRLAEVLERCREQSPAIAGVGGRPGRHRRAPRRWRREAWDAFGRLDVLVNNAGAPKRRAVTELTLDEIRQTMTLNFESPVRMAQAVLPRMLERDRGVIVNVSSFAGRVGVPAEAAYSRVEVRAVRLERVDGPRPLAHRRRGPARAARRHRHRDLGPARQRPALLQRARWSQPGTSPPASSTPSRAMASSTTCPT